MYATNRKEDESRGCFLYLHRPFAAKQHVLRLLIREVQLLLAEHEVERLRLARSQRNTRKVREALQRIALLSSLPFTPSTHSYQRRLHKQQNALVSLTTSRVGHFHVHVDRQRGAESVIPNLPNLHGVGERRVGQAEAERMNHRTREEPIRSSRESRFLRLNASDGSYLFRTHVHIEVVQIRHVVIIIHRVHKSTACFSRASFSSYSDSRLPRSLRRSPGLRTCLRSPRPARPPHAPSAHTH